MASVPVEGRGSLVYVEGFSDLLREPLFFPLQDLGIIPCVTMTSGRDMFHNAELGCFPSVCSRNLVPSILAVSLYTTPYCFSFLDLSLGFTNRDLKVLKRIVVGGYTMGSKYPLQLFWSPETLGMHTGCLLAAGPSVLLSCYLEKCCHFISISQWS